MKKGKLFEVYDKERNEIVNYKGGFAGGGLAITQEGDLVFLGSIEWDYPEDSKRYEIRWVKTVKNEQEEKLRDALENTNWGQFR